MALFHIVSNYILYYRKHLNWSWHLKRFLSTGVAYCGAYTAAHLVPTPLSIPSIPSIPILRRWNQLSMGWRRGDGWRNTISRLGLLLLPRHTPRRYERRARVQTQCQPSGNLLSHNARRLSFPPRLLDLRTHVCVTPSTFSSGLSYFFSN